MGKRLLKWTPGTDTPVPAPQEGSTATMLELPPEDRTLSPYTGWTRAHWEAVADHWLLGLRPHATPGHAGILPPGRHSVSGAKSDSLEGFARSFLAASARIAGAEGKDPHDHAGWYAEGLANATLPGGPERWGRAADTRRCPEEGPAQPIVEASAVAFGLALSKPYLWDRLDAEVQERVADWLAHHANLRAWGNNWLLFTAITEAFLSSVGRPIDNPHAEADVAHVEDWYLGEGWYNDGTAAMGRNVDHYNSWVIHPYLWMWYQLRGEQAPSALRERMRTRLGAFSTSYAELFAPNGAPLFQGRSLAYRTAVLGGPWAAGLEGVGQSPGAVRRLASGTLRHFTEAQRAGVDGPLTLGWSDAEYLPMMQGYSGPGSPYWAGIGFLGLAAPADHDLWTATEQPQPADPDSGAPPVSTWPSVGWVVQRDAAEGSVRVANHGSDHLPPGEGDGYYGPLYAKFGYSTHTAPGFGRAWQEGRIDGHIALLDAWERPTSRGSIREFATGAGWAASWHAPAIGGKPLPGARIVTASALDCGVEVRCHLVTVPHERWELIREGGTATVVGSGPTSGVLPLHGWGEQVAAGTARFEGSSPLGDATETPYLTRPRPEGGEALLVTLHGPAGGEVPVEVDVEGTTVTLRWISGRVDVLVLGELFAGE
jgi:hypothetical protein